MDTINLVGKIIGTTNKSDYQSKGKTAYIVLKDEEEFKKANEFGFTIYTSKDTGEDFIIVRTPEKLQVFNNKDNTRYTLPSVANAEVKNYYTTNDVYLSIGKGVSNEYKNTYYRLLAIGLNDLKEVEFVSPLNPFTEKEAINGGDIIA